jgi:hypothetical protein
MYDGIYLRNPRLLEQTIVNLLFHITPYELGQCTEVPFSFIKFFSSKILSHVRLIRGSAERCDTQRLNKAVYGLGR